MVGAITPTWLRGIAAFILNEVLALEEYKDNGRQRQVCSKGYRTWLRAWLQKDVRDGVGEVVGSEAARLLL